MKYKEIEIKEFTCDKTVVFDPPKMMLVWDAVTGTPQVDDVSAYLPMCCILVKSVNLDWHHCAEIPKEPTHRRDTIREVAKWLNHGLA